ncbi:MAG: hypothetical protein RL535_653 [Pseudomonadota bacterium]
MIKRIISLVLLITCISIAATAQIKLDDPLPIDPKVKVGQLANGLTYYVAQNAKPEKRVLLQLVVKAGSSLEDDDQQGLAHFLEHMAFNGTKNFPKNELVSYLQTIGVKFGADLNAYTSFDETVYTLPIPTDKKENVAKGFQILQDWAQGMLLDDKDIDDERAVVLGELRDRKNFGLRLLNQTLPKVLEGSNYASRFPIGKADIIQNFKPDSLKRFYKDWYRPNLMAVIVVGDIDSSEAEKMIRSHFNQLTNPDPVRERKNESVTKRIVTEALIAVDSEAVINKLDIYYPAKTHQAILTVQDFSQKVLLSKLFNQLMQQRLQEASIAAIPPFNSGSSAMSPLFVKNYEAFTITGILGKAGIEKAVQALLAESLRVKKFGFTAQEVDRAKKIVLGRYERMNNERDKTESDKLASEYMRNFLTQEFIPGIVNEFLYASTYLPQISQQDINSYSAKLIPNSDQPKLVVYSGSDKPEFSIPTPAELVTMVEKAESTTVIEKTETVAVTELMQIPPTAGSISSETVDKETGLMTLVLSNGLRVTLKPTNFKSDEVVMSAVRYGGQSLFGDADRFNAQYMPTVASAMGLGQFSRQDLGKMLSGKTASANLFFDMEREGLRGSSSIKDLETMLQMAHLQFARKQTRPIPFQAFMSKEADSARQIVALPELYFLNEIMHHTFAAHPRAPRLPKVEDFKQIQLQRVLDIHADRFSSAKGLHFVFVGNFDVAMLKPLLATYLASLPVKDLETQYKDLGVRKVQGVIKNEVRKGLEQKSVISLSFHGEAKYHADEAMKLNILKEVINIKLIEVLREKLGLIYSANASHNMMQTPYQNYSIDVLLPCAPSKIEQVLEALQDELQKLKTSGPEMADLDKVKSNLAIEHRKNIENNKVWQSLLERASLTEAKVDNFITFPSRFNKVTIEDIKLTANRYLNPANSILTILKPEK